MTTRESPPNAAGAQQPSDDGSVFRSPTSFAQERLWFLDQFEPDSPLYNLAVALRAKGNISLDALERSVQTLVDRHETLRTIFGTEDGRPVQVILPSLRLDMSVEDLSMLPPAEREAELTRQAQAENSAPFNLALGPLFRVRFLKMNNSEYALFFTFHHIISDGWSIGLFFRELNQLYTAFAQGHTLDLPELAIQYADFAAWQKEWLRGETLAQEMAFWKEHLAGAPGLLQIPGDRPRPAAQTFAGSREKFQFSAAQTEALEGLARKYNVTPFMLLLAAYEVLLYRYTGQADFVVGTPIAGRTRIELEPLIGFFTNTLVLRANLAGDPTFKDVLVRVRDTSLNAFVHQDVPFEKLVEELQPERSLSYNPLFQVMFAYQNTPDQDVQLGDLELGEVITQRIRSKFDLTLTCWKEEQAIRASLEYNADILDRETVTRMVANFITLMNGIIAAPEARIADLPIISAPELAQMTAWNATALDVPSDRTVAQLISAQAQRTPAAPAITCDGQTLTYAEFEARTNQFANHLVRQGVRPDQPVGLCVSRSIDMVVAMVGILKAGGAYVPLDPDYPAERLAFMVGDAHLAALVVGRDTAPTAPAFRGPRVSIDEDWPTIAAESATPPTVAVSAADLAYIIYTSGSTGVPKGVQIPHGALVNFLASMRQQPGMIAQDVGLALTSISFDIAGLEVYLPLTVGARVVVVNREVAMDAAQLAQVITSEGVTFIQATPATWRALLATGWAGAPHLTLLSGGEALSRDLAEALLARGKTLWNMYGPTETTIWSTLQRVTTADGPIPIGKPIANTQIALLDSHLSQVPIGVTGELYIGGAGLARGYRGRPDLTAERFVANPFTEISGARLYRTGDAARYRPDGSIEYLGRLDSQVKVRGFRIELGEIEAVLATYPGVTAAVVIVREDAPGDQRITAYLVMEGAEPTTTNDLRAHLQTRLPAYMLPAAYVTLPAFPLTPNGKVDRRALPAPEAGNADERSYIAPATPEEVALAAIWGDLLGVDPIGLNDNFFELGGHSLLATQLMSRIRETFVVELPLRTLFESPTVGELAAAITKAKAEGLTPRAAQTPIMRSARRQQVAGEG